MYHLVRLTVLPVRLAVLAARSTILQVSFTDARQALLSATQGTFASPYTGQNNNGWCVSGTRG